MMVQQRIFRPGAQGLATVTLQNTGNVPTAFIIEVTPGTTGLLRGFTQDRSPLRIATPLTSPGVETSVRLPFTFSDLEGDRAFLVVIGEAGPTGRLVQEFDRQVFAGQARIEALIEMPLPEEIIPEEILPEITPPENLASRFSDGLGTPRISLESRTATQGQSIRGTLAISNLGGVPFSPLLAANVVDLLGTEVGMVIPPRRLTLGVNENIQQSFNIDTSRLSVDPGSGFSEYDIRILLIDDQTGILLLDETLENLFRVTVPLAPLEEPPVEEPPLALPTPRPRAGDLRVNIAFSEPTVVKGESVGFSAAIRNLQNFEFLANVSVSLTLQSATLPTEGITSRQIIPPERVAFPEGTQRSLVKLVDTSDFQAGIYEVRVLATTIDTGEEILRETFRDALTILPIISREPEILPRRGEPGFPLQVRDPVWGSPELFGEEAEALIRVRAQATIVNVGSDAHNSVITFSVSNIRSLQRWDDVESVFLLAGGQARVDMSVFLPGDATGDYIRFFQMDVSGVGRDIVTGPQFSL